MKAIILSSGVGFRLRPETENLPKSLLKLNDKTILDIEIENLTCCGIEDIIITVGHKDNLMREYIAATYPLLDITFVKNRKFNSTNYIYSIWLTKELIDDDVVILHGDMVFEERLLKRLLQHPSDNGALINNVIKPPEKDFKAVVQDDVVKQIGVDLFGANAFFCAPIYKFSGKSFSRWLVEIDAFVQKGNVTCYAEEAFNRIADEVELRAVYYSDEFCMEVDTPRDLEKAREYYKRG